MTPDIAPSHVRESGGIDLALPCSCTRVPMAGGRACPCVCHLDRAGRVARHCRFHVASASWCPACRAIETGDPLGPARTSARDR